MSYSADQLANLRSAIAEGVLKVRFSDGREMTYRSLAEMLETERRMAAEVETAQVKPVRRIYQTFQRA
jgi:bisphosphoglycerate-independent phosphoglycerate mutase (AlkP superfamily)